MVAEVDLQLGVVRLDHSGVRVGYTMGCCSGQGIQGLCLNALFCQSTLLETTLSPVSWFKTT